jgi:hypothetical protein
LLRTIASASALVVVEIAAMCTTPLSFPRLVSRNALVVLGGMRSQTAFGDVVPLQIVGAKLVAQHDVSARRVECSSELEPMKPAPPVMTITVLLLPPAARAVP